MVKEKTIRQFVSSVSDQHYTMTGAVIAMSAAQAAALGEACMQISLDHQVDTLNWQNITTRIEQMTRLKDNLLEWGSKDTVAITERVALREADSSVEDQQFWFESAAQISRLSIESAHLLKNFRPFVFADVQDDMEITIRLLTDAARSALLLLDSNFNIWPNTDLCDEYKNLHATLQTQIDQLME